MIEPAIVAGWSVVGACAVGFSGYVSSTVSNTEWSDRAVCQWYTAMILVGLLVAISSDTECLASYLSVVIAQNLKCVACVMVSVGCARCWVILARCMVGSGLASELRSMLGIIEVLSTSFRTVSLSLRIMVNMLAGHVLLSICMGVQQVALGSMSAVLSVFGTTVYGVCAGSLEVLCCGVFGLLKVLTCVIQCDVLVRLLGIYWADCGS